MGRSISALLPCFAVILIASPVFSQVRYSVTPYGSCPRISRSSAGSTHDSNLTNTGLISFALAEVSNESAPYIRVLNFNILCFSLAPERYYNSSTNSSIHLWSTASFLASYNCMGAACTWPQPNPDPNQVLNITAQFYFVCASNSSGYMDEWDLVNDHLRSLNVTSGVVNYSPLANFSTPANETCGSCLYTGHSGLSNYTDVNPVTSCFGKITNRLRTKLGLFCVTTIIGCHPSCYEEPSFGTPLCVSSLFYHASECCRFYHDNRCAYECLEQYIFENETCRLLGI